MGFCTYNFFVRSMSKTGCIQVTEMSSNQYWIPLTRWIQYRYLSSNLSHMVAASHHENCCFQLILSYFPFPIFLAPPHNFYSNLLLVITKLVSACIRNMKKNTFTKSNTTAQISLWKILPYISWTQLDRFVFKNWENQTHFQIGSDLPAPTKVTQNDEKYFGAEFCVWYGLLLNSMTHLL